MSVSVFILLCCETSCSCVVYSFCEIGAFLQVTLITHHLCIYASSLRILLILVFFVFLSFLLQCTSPHDVGLCVLDPRPRALRTHGTAPTLVVSVDSAQPAEEFGHRLHLCALCAAPHGRVYQRRRAAVTVSCFEWYDEMCFWCT